MKISAKPVPNQPGFKCTFRHPVTKKLSSYGLSTHDKDEAGRICLDTATVLTDSTLPTNDPEHMRWQFFHGRALAIAFGQEFADRVAAKREQGPVLDFSDIARIAAALINQFGIDLARQDELVEFLSEFESQRYNQLQQDFERSENRVRVLEPQNEELTAALTKYQRASNVHVKTTMKDAAELWKAGYQEGRATHTYTQAKGAIDSFVKALPGCGSFRLAEVKGKHLDDWTASLVGDEKQTLSPITKKKLRAYVSSFFTWAVRKYDLSENPIERAMPIAGVSRNPEHIKAIRRLEDLTTFIEGLQNHPYWQAWAAVACFAGPRWSEQAWLKIDDVYLDENFIRITSRTSGPRIVGTKTGRERNIPIESTVLKQILQNHVERRRAEQKKRNATPAQKSQWLFPSMVPDNKYSPREKTPVGIWSQGGVFGDAWKKIALKAKGKSKDAFWSYGASEWRHTFGTILGQCGWTSLEIARAMGNSPTIAERHYIAVGKGGHRWPFKY